jgi:osmotically inducible protein OsmC
MREPIYTAEATVTGGRAEGHASSSDGALDVQLRRPAEMGGEGGGTNPEQLFAVGYAACFDSALGAVARRQRVDPGETSVSSRVSLIPTEDRRFVLAVELDVELPNVADQEDAVQLVAAADKVCPYSNALRDNVEVRLTANGHQVGRE